MQDRVATAMKQLGFTANGARTYLSLLEENPATGYEIAARSGVPRSAIYDVLRRLTEMGLVNAIHDKPTRYVPLDPENLYGLIENRFGRDLEELKTAMKSLVGKRPEVPTWTLRGYDQLIERAHTLINGAKKSVYASLWAREAKRLTEPLKAAVERGVNVITFSFTPLPDGIGRVVSYDFAEKELEQHWDHRMILLADDTQVLVGTADQSDAAEGVVTGVSAIVEMARSNLVLDITLLGERLGVDTADIVEALTSHLAPVEEMLRAKAQ